MANHLIVLTSRCLSLFQLGEATTSHYRISEKEYIKTIQEEIAKVIKLQEELDLDVLVHGEPEVKYSTVDIYAISFHVVKEV